MVQCCTLPAQGMASALADGGLKAYVLTLLGKEVANRNRESLGAPLAQPTKEREVERW